MTTIARIVEKFTMEIDAPPPGRDSWFLDYVLRSPREAGRHLTAGWMALNSLKEAYRGADDIVSSMEWFGGMGAQALMAERLFNLDQHTVQEFSLEGCEHLYRVMPSHVKIVHGDSYDRSKYDDSADLQILDFGDLTVWKTREDQPHRELLDHVFAEEPKAVVFTDIACRYLHLHRERYESLLGADTCVDYETYLDAFLGRFEALYGYTLVAGYWDRWSAVMALVPDGVAPRGLLRPTPASPVGLELL